MFYTICKYTIPITKHRKMYIFLIHLTRINNLQILTTLNPCFGPCPHKPNLARVLSKT